jgi:hypothetical protein
MFVTLKLTSGVTNTDFLIMAVMLVSLELMALLLLAPAVVSVLATVLSVAVIALVVTSVAVLKGLVTNVKPKDNEEATILIFSDYLEEIGLVELAQEIRESVSNNKINEHSYDYIEGNVGGEGGSFPNSLRHRPGADLKVRDWVTIDTDFGDNVGYHAGVGDKWEGDD